jgi:hypothetical protein
MSTERARLTPRQRLSMSRQALIEQLYGGDRISSDDGLDPPARRRARSHPARWAAVARHVVRRWWRRHPVNAAGQLARPLLERYAREQPVKLIAIAAATGALVVLARPWRLLSISAVTAAALKSSDLADLVTTLMHKTGSPRKDAP